MGGRVNKVSGQLNLSPTKSLTYKFAKAKNTNLLKYPPICCTYMLFSLGCRINGLGWSTFSWLYYTSHRWPERCKDPRCMLWHWTNWTKGESYHQKNLKFHVNEISYTRTLWWDWWGGSLILNHFMYIEWTSSQYHYPLIISQTGTYLYTSLID